MTKWTIVSCLLITCMTSYGQRVKKLDGAEISIAQVDSTVLHLMDTAHVTGLALAIINDDKIVHQKAYGFKNNENRALLDTTTVFYGASFSKAVFAYFSLLLVQEGILDLDKPLYQYLDQPLPKYDKYKDLSEYQRWQHITARMCLSHTTGFPNWRFLNANTGDFEADGKLAIYFTPGSKYAYSGEGIALLQMVIEEITGSDLEDLTKEKVFNPIGMTRSSYVWKSHFENDYAVGHDENERSLKKKKRNKAGAAGSLETTIADYARFILFLMQDKGLNDQYKNEMLTPQIAINSKYQFPTISEEITTENKSINLSYGLGWGLLESRYGKAFFKEGHDEGWQHYNINFEDEGTSIIIMTNSSNGEMIFKALLEHLIGDTFTPWAWERYIPYDLETD